MRVIAGDKKGRKLVTPEGLDTRPTSDKVKEALFSIVQFELDGAAFLDLFAGSGQMGIEALSRGADRAVFVDNGRKPCECIRKNLSDLSLSDRAEVNMRDISDYLFSCKEEFDVIFLDPPYKDGISQNLLESVVAVAKETAVIICEIPEKSPLCEECAGFSLRRRYRYGKTELALFRRSDSESEIY